MIHFCKLAIITVSITCLSGCGGSTKEVKIVNTVPEPVEIDVPGGHHSYTDSDAPKEIVSDELIHLDCWFASELPEPGYGKYFFKADLGEDGKVTGSYRYSEPDRSFVFPDFEFETDASFMNECNDIIKGENLAIFNGVSEETSGIPDDYGCSMDALYLTEETLYFHDNASNYFSENAMKAFYDLFYEKSGAKAFYDTDELLNVSYRIYEEDVYSFYADIYKTSDGNIYYSVSEKADGKWKPDRNGEAPSDLLEKISAVYKDNDMESIQTYPRREGERFYTLALQFGKEDKYTYSNTALSDEQLEALAGIRDLILERIGQ